MKIAFITYNTLPNLSNGWIRNGENEALIVQDTNRRGSLEEGGRTRSTEEIENGIEETWRKLSDSLLELDHLVVYVGANGSEKAIEQAAKLPVDKLTFIGCSCGIDKKEDMIQQVGLDKARRMLCECGGHRTMTSMICRFLDTGVIL